MKAKTTGMIVGLILLFYGVGVSSGAAGTANPFSPVEVVSYLFEFTGVAIFTTSMIVGDETAREVNKRSK